MLSSLSVLSTCLVIMVHLHHIGLSYLPDMSHSCMTGLVCMMPIGSFGVNSKQVVDPVMCVSWALAGLLTRQVTILLCVFAGDARGVHLGGSARGRGQKDRGGEALRRDDGQAREGARRQGRQQVSPREGERVQCILAKPERAP